MLHDTRALKALRRKGLGCNVTLRMLQKKGYIPKGNIKKGLGGKSKKSYPKKGTFPFTKPRHLPYGPNFKGFSAATQPGDAAIMAFIFCTSVRLMPSTGRSSASCHTSAAHTRSRGTSRSPRPRPRQNDSRSRTLKYRHFSGMGL